MCRIVRAVLAAQCEGAACDVDIGVGGGVHLDTVGFVGGAIDVVGTRLVYSKVNLGGDAENMMSVGLGCTLAVLSWTHLIPLWQQTGGGFDYLPVMWAFDANLTLLTNIAMAASVFTWRRRRSRMAAAALVLYTLIPRTDAEGWEWSRQSHAALARVALSAGVGALALGATQTQIDR